jgi:glutamine---fructose-6-phosphate transaminase (isomerizing)
MPGNRPAPMAEPAASHMLREALEAPQAVARQLERNDDLCRELGARLRRSMPPLVATCARGSSDNAATYAKYLIEISLGCVVASVGPSIRSVYGVAPALRDAVFLAISQSGRSPDLLSLAEVAREGGAISIAIVNDETSPLAELCEFVLPVHAGPEQSIAATKSWLASLAAVLHLVACWTNDETMAAALQTLPADLATAARNDWRGALDLVAGTHDLYVVGRGPGFAAAQEVALKLKEVTGIHAEAYSAAELRHGPMALAGPDFPVLALSQEDASLPGMLEFVDSLVARGVPLAVAGPASRPGTLALPMADKLHPFVAPICAVQSFYPLADRLARARGRDPDRPPHLSKVTETL